MYIEAEPMKTKCVFKFELYDSMKDGIFPDPEERSSQAAQNINNLKILADQLKKDGYIIGIKEDPLWNAVSVSITYDSDSAPDRTRGAGRHKKRSGMSCKDVFDYRQAHTQKETAAWLGVSISTYQRCEAAAKKDNIFNDSDIAGQNNQYF